MKLEPPNWLRQEQALADEITRLRADLAKAHVWIEELGLNNRNARADIGKAQTELATALRTVERLREGLERIAGTKGSSEYLRILAREALSATTPSAEPVVKHPPAEATVRKT